MTVRTPLQSGSAEHGFTPSEHGFTLIELLVALFIFGLLAAAGVALLSGTVSAQSAVLGRLDQDGQGRRMSALLTADLAQAVPRISRTENGALAPAFFAAPAGAGMPLFHLVRAGRDNPDDVARPGVEKIEYWLVDGRLERRAYPALDGTPAGPPLVLAEHLARVDVAFRDASGGWASSWTPAQGDQLPLAVRLILQGDGRAAPLTMLFLVGPGAGRVAPPQGAGRVG